VKYVKLTKYYYPSPKIRGHARNALVFCIMPEFHSFILKHGVYIMVYMGSEESLTYTNGTLIVV
jgi:hypothetical protein